MDLSYFTPRSIVLTHFDFGEGIGGGDLDLGGFEGEPDKPRHNYLYTSAEIN
jgi:hypothetical protein